jgi:YegS/Rv2252/BmrU family lipid kinase
MREENKKIMVIYNPGAGKGEKGKVLGQIKSRFKSNYTRVDIEVSDYADHLRELGQRAVEEDYDRVISVGGDGTTFEIINGIYAKGRPAKRVELGIIPAGTGNSFLRDFGDVSQPRWMDIIFKGKHRPLDMVKFQYVESGKEKSKYFINILGVGKIADILRLSKTKLNFFGVLSYSLAVLISMFKRIRNQISITVDAKTYEFKNSALVISNSKFTGGNMKIAPMAETDDGKVDLIVFDNVNRRQIVQIFSGVFKGKHVHHPKVKIFSGTEIEVKSTPELYLMADGELLGKTPLKLKVLAKELSFLS